MASRVSRFMVRSLVWRGWWWVLGGKDSPCHQLPAPRKGSEEKEQLEILSPMSFISTLEDMGVSENRGT